MRANNTPAMGMSDKIMSKNVDTLKLKYCNLSHSFHESIIAAWNKLNQRIMGQSGKMNLSVAFSSRALKELWKTYTGLFTMECSKNRK